MTHYPIALNLYNKKKSSPHSKFLKKVEPIDLNQIEIIEDSFDYKGYLQSEMKRKISRLPEEEQKFVNGYFQQRGQLAKDRMKFFRIIKKLQKM